MKKGKTSLCMMRCDRNNVGYITGIARNPVLEELARQWTYESAKQFEQTGQKQRIFGEFMYAADTWEVVSRIFRTFLCKSFIWSLAFACQPHGAGDDYRSKPRPPRPQLSSHPNASYSYTFSFPSECLQYA
jgi:hypothetical protein